ncbi:hypothetical protein AAKU55_005523 [Oxalobacteraceae bacterium GrIS 1.11]
MAAIADFLPHVLPYVRGCSFPLAELHVRNVCIDFCANAPIVQANIDPFDALAGCAEYDIDTPYGTETTLILGAWFEGRHLAILKTGDRDSSGFESATGAPTGLQQAAGNTFRLDIAPAVNSVKAITMRVATKPTRNAGAVADVLLNDYAYEIGQGVVARLMKIPGFHFSDPGNAGAYEAVYLLARNSARIRAMQSFGTAPTRIKPRRFA